MQYIFLPGYSLKNRDFAYELVDEIKKLSSNEINFDVLEWAHWQDNHGGGVDLKTELDKLKTMVKPGPYTIVAKSIGTWVAAHYLFQVKELPAKVIFLGLPINDLSQDEQKVYVDLVNNFPKLNLTIMQNKKDSHGTDEQVKALFSSRSLPVELIATEGEDHNYTYYPQIHRLLIAV